MQYYEKGAFKLKQAVLKKKRTETKEVGPERKMPLNLNELSCDLFMRGRLGLTVPR